MFLLVSSIVFLFLSFHLLSFTLQEIRTRQRFRYRDFVNVARMWQYLVGSRESCAKSEYQRGTSSTYWCKMPFARLPEIKTALVLISVCVLIGRS
jgi:hypothetical protein